MEYVERDATDDMGWGICEVRFQKMLFAHGPPVKEKREKMWKKRKRSINMDQAKPPDSQMHDKTDWFLAHAVHPKHIRFRANVQAKNTAVLESPDIDAEKTPW